MNGFGLTVMGPWPQFTVALALTSALTSATAGTAWSRASWTERANEGEGVAARPPLTANTLAHRTLEARALIASGGRALSTARLARGRRRGLAAVRRARIPGVPDVEGTRPIQERGPARGASFQGRTAPRFLASTGSIARNPSRARSVSRRYRLLLTTISWVCATPQRRAARLIASPTTPTCAR